jgi:hypothetical protein
MGFGIVSAGGEVDGVPVSPNHAGDGQPRVLFRKVLARKDCEG